MKQIKPRGDRVLVLRDTNDISEGGIHLPGTRAEKPITGVVVEVGEELKKRVLIDHGRCHSASEAENENWVRYETATDPAALKPGDHVMFGQHAGMEVELDGRKYLMLRADEVVGVIVDDGVPKSEEPSEPPPETVAFYDQQPGAPQGV